MAKARAADVERWVCDIQYFERMKQERLPGSVDYREAKRGADRARGQLASYGLDEGGNPRSS